MINTQPGENGFPKHKWKGIGGKFCMSRRSSFLFPVTPICAVAPPLSPQWTLTDPFIFWRADWSFMGAGWICENSDLKSTSYQLGCTKVHLHRNEQTRHKTKRQPAPTARLCFLHSLTRLHTPSAGRLTVLPSNTNGKNRAVIFQTIIPYYMVCQFSRC